MRTILIVIVSLVAIVLGNIFLKVPQAAIEIAAESIGLGPVSNALLTSFILSLIIIIVAFFVGRRLKERPKGLQNIIEALIEGLENLVFQIASKKWAPRIFPFCVTIFIFLLISNWFGLLSPLLGSVGIVHVSEHGGLTSEQITFLYGTEEQVLEEHHSHHSSHHDNEAKFVIVPFLRAPSSDLNLTLALALITMFLVQVFGFWSRGFGYLNHFFRFKSLRTKGIAMGSIDIVVGLIEFISEFSKVISFSFRLFGNVFAGEVILIVISSLVSLGAVLVFFGLEIFVGMIQAFVFFILSVSFLALATAGHEDH